MDALASILRHMIYFVMKAAFICFIRRLSVSVLPALPTAIISMPCKEMKQRASFVLALNGLFSWFVPWIFADDVNRFRNCSDYIG